MEKTVSQRTALLVAAFLPPLLVCAGLAVLWIITLLRQLDPDGWVQIATLAGTLAYLVLFLRPLDYVYGWFKAQSFVAFVFVGAVVGGAAWLNERHGPLRWPGWPDDDRAGRSGQSDSAGYCTPGL